MNAPTIIGTLPELIAAIRVRKDQLNLSYEKLDEIANLPERYSVKVLAPKPSRGLSYMNLGAIMGALGMGLTVVDDPRTTAMVSKHWEPRKRSMPSIAAPAQEMPINVEHLIKTWLSGRMREIGIKGNKSSVRRANEMKRRARQRKASHAARKRWNKHA